MTRVFPVRSIELLPIFHVKVSFVCMLLLKVVGFRFRVSGVRIEKLEELKPET